MWTSSGVRLRPAFARPGPLNWLFVPGGPGLGSESLQGLADAVSVPGSGWFVDLPGDGSNVSPARIGDQPFSHWPDALVEAALTFDHVVMVGHSTGGMFILSVPELSEHVVGMVLLDTAPDARWRAAFGEYAQRNPIPAVDAAAVHHRNQADNQSLRELTIAAAPWNFTAAGLPAGLRLLSGLPYNNDAVTWAEENFDDDYRARWTPENIPTLILGGEFDNIVDQSVWADSRGFSGANVMRRTIVNAGHFPWVENPRDIDMAFADFSGAFWSHEG